MTSPTPPAEAKRKKRAELGRCCPVMTLVLSRCHERFGISAELAINFTTGGERTVIVTRFPKAKGEARKTDKFKDSTYAPLNYCPFCGEKLPQ